MMEAYVEAIRAMLQTEGLEATNMANHMALDAGLITLPMFQAGAKVLAKVIMDR